MSAAFVVAAFTAIGNRERNEDRVGTWGSAGDRLQAWAVADGLGGHQAGDVAAQHAVDAALRCVEHALDDTPETVVRKALEAAQGAVLEARAQAGPRSDMATTLALVVSDGERVAWGHAGDTRVYRLRDGRAEVLTRDHTVAESMRTLAGQPQNRSLAPEHSNSLISAIGNDDAFFDVSDVEPLLADDVFLICSDGLWAHVPERALVSDRQAAADLPEWIERLRHRVEDAQDPHQDNYSGIAFCRETDSLHERSKPSLFAKLLQRT